MFISWSEVRSSTKPHCSVHYTVTLLIWHWPRMVHIIPAHQRLAHVLNVNSDTRLTASYHFNGNILFDVMWHSSTKTNFSLFFSAKFDWISIKCEPVFTPDVSNTAVRSVALCYFPFKFAAVVPLWCTSIKSETNLSHTHDFPPRETAVWLPFPKTDFILSYFIRILISYLNVLVLVPKPNQAVFLSRPDQEILLTEPNEVVLVAKSNQTKMEAYLF